MATALFSALLLSPAQAAPAPAAGTPAHHDRAPDERFRLQPLTGGVHALFGRGGNVGFLVGPDAVLVVDSQFKDMAPGIVEQIQRVTDKPIKYLANTHHHGDHVDGNDTFRPIAVIIAHDNVRKRMLASPQAILREFLAEVDLPAYKDYQGYADRFRANAAAAWDELGS
jgi:glyoxylase-like metal-dependent hydrolase (beta-lactamase superfamily II)